MLNKIIFILTNEYKVKMEHSDEYRIFIEEMDSHGTNVTLFNIEEYREKRNSRTAEKTTDCLFLSDHTETLTGIQESGGYTVAVYHDGVDGILSGTQFAIEEIEGVEWEYFYKVYQRFANEPWQITETKRCIIREMSVADVDDLYELYRSPAVTKYTEPLFEDREKEIQYIKDYIENIYKYYGFGMWLIVRKEDGKLIGRAGFDYRPGFADAELGFVIGEPFWRNGYAYEVCSLLMELGKTVYGFEKVQALVRAENEASVQLLKKLGFDYTDEVMVNGQKYERFMSKLAI